MEDDDDVSFLSISDSESDAEYSACLTTLNSAPTTDGVLRSSSPASSVTSIRSQTRRSATKRRAPLPPIPKVVAAAAASIKQKTRPESSKMPASALQKSFSGSKLRTDNIVSTKAPLPSSNKGLKPKISAVTSHPMKLVQGSSLKSKEPSCSSGNKNPFVRSSSKDFSTLQHIDDEERTVNAVSSEALSVSPPVVAPEVTFVTTTIAASASDPNIQYVNPEPAHSTAQSYATTPMLQQNLPSTNDLAYGPMFFTSVNSPGTENRVSPMQPVSPMFPIMPSSISALQTLNFNQNYHLNPSQLLAGLPLSSAQDLSGSRVTFVPQSSSFSPIGEASSSMMSSCGIPRVPLVHSASDLGVHQIMVPSSREPKLASLSEEEEDDDDDEDCDYADDSFEVQRYKSPRLSRSDSNVTVAHMYEDIIVSKRFNLRLSFTNLTLGVMATAFFIPNSAALIFSIFRLIFGTLFPAYYSYKAVRTKNVKEYVKWMMYWIVFALFTCVETITDVFVSFWFPFYYEIKILMVLWLLSPATKGSSILYRKFVHPWLTRREEEIDDCIAKAKEQGYSTVVQLGTKGVNYATTVIMQTAIKGGGGLVSQLKRSYSASEISEDTVDLGGDLNSNVKAIPYNMTSDEDDVSTGSFEPRHRAESESSTTRTRGHSTGRASRSNKTRSADVSDVYFPEAPEAVTQRRSPRTHDVMSASTGGGSTHQTRKSRTTEQTSNYATLPRTASKRASAAKKRQA